MAKWQTLSSEEVYSTPWIRIRRDAVLNHNGKPLTYSVVELRHPSVFIIAVNDENKILLQKNYRYTINKMIWEFPAGHSDGQDMLEAARRELLEEAGLTSDDWTHIGRLYQAIGTANMPLSVCLARNVQPAKNRVTEEVEQVEEQRFLSVEEIEAMAKRNEMINATDLGALYLAKLHGL